MTVFNIEEILQHFDIGNPQISGPVLVIPLLEKTKNVSPFIPFEEIKFLGTRDYGEMVFKEHPEKPTLVPSGFSIVTKAEAQDHGIVELSIIPAGDGKVIIPSYCIEETQGGYIREHDEFVVNVLPKNVRYETLLNRVKHPKKRERISFSGLWSSIRKFQQGLTGDKTYAHYTYFLEEYKDRLDKFVAAFESVDKQRGAIVVVKNKIAGVEVSPTTEDWEFSFRRVLRDAYGTSLIAQQQRGDKIDHIRFNYKGSTLSEIRSKMQQSDKDLQELAVDKLKVIETSKQVLDEELGYIKIITNNQMVGELIVQDGSIHYASIFSERY